MNSVPEPIDVLNNKIRQLEIEKEAIKREGTSLKSERIEEELKSCREELSGLMARWNEEKGIVTELNNLRQQIEDDKREAAIAEREGNLGKVAEIRYGRLTQAQQRIAELSEKQAQIKDLENEKAALESEMAEMSKVKPINVHESIFFNLASAKIVSKKEELNIKAYAEAAAAVGAKLAVVGYADISGSTEYNIKLSQQRAEAVAELLRANGAEVVVVSGNGETEEYKERFLNRRVIIKVYEE